MPLVKHILPLLVIGIFFGAIVIDAISPEIIASHLGTSSLYANGLASLPGTLIYIGTLTEVPLVSMLIQSGMGQGPALTMLLVGPTISLPSLLVFGRLLGFSRALTYVLLVMVMSSISGLMFGTFF